MNLVSIRSDNGLAPNRRQALSKPVLVIVNWAFRNKFHWNFNQISNSFIQENAFKYVVCEMAAILSMGKWVNWTPDFPFQEASTTLTIVSSTTQVSVPSPVAPCTSPGMSNTRTRQETLHNNDHVEDLIIPPGTPPPPYNSVVSIPCGLSDTCQQTCPSSVSLPSSSHQEQPKERTVLDCVRETRLWKQGLSKRLYQHNLTKKLLTCRTSLTASSVHKVLIVNEWF